MANTDRPIQLVKRQTSELYNLHACNLITDNIWSVFLKWIAYIWLRIKYRVIIKGWNVHLSIQIMTNKKKKTKNVRRFFFIMRFWSFWRNPYYIYYKQAWFDIRYICISHFYFSKPHSMYKVYDLRIEYIYTLYRLIYYTISR